MLAAHRVLALALISANAHAPYTWHVVLLAETHTQLRTGYTLALKAWCDVQVLPKDYGGQAEMITLQDYVKMHILPKQLVSDTLYTALLCILQSKQLS